MAQTQHGANDAKKTWPAMIRTRDTCFPTFRTALVALLADTVKLHNTHSKYIHARRTTTHSPLNQDSPANTHRARTSSAKPGAGFEPQPSAPPSPPRQMRDEHAASTQIPCSFAQTRCQRGGFQLVSLPPSSWFPCGARNWTTSCCFWSLIPSNCEHSGPLQLRGPAGSQ